MPTEYRTAIPHSNNDDGTGTTISSSDSNIELDGECSKHSILASDLAVAQQRLSDGSTLVHEIVVLRCSMVDQLLNSQRATRRERDGADEECIRHLDDDTSSLRSERSKLYAGSVANLSDIERDDARGVVRLGIKPDDDGPLRLYVQPM